MPSLNDSRKIIKTDIPGINGSEVELWDELTVGDTEQIQLLENNVQKGIYTVFCLIKSWNLDEELTIDNVKSLNTSQFEYLLSKTKVGSDALKEASELENDALEKKTA